MSEALLATIATLALSSKESSYASNGFHFIHCVRKDKLVPLAKFFLDAGFVLEMLTCQDRMSETETMRLCYTFNRFGTEEEVQRHLLHLEIKPSLEKAPTLSKILPAANWFEREVYDMFGVYFARHPNLTRILLPDDVDFHALRKDFGRIEDAEESSDV